MREREGCGHEGEGGVQGVGEKRRRGEKERRKGEEKGDEATNMY